MTVKSMIKQIDRRITSLEKERDKLDDLIVDMESLREDYSEAYNSLIDARDALSRIV